MLRTFCRCRRLPFQFAPKFSAGFVRSRCGLPKRFARAFVGFSLLRRFRPGSDKLRSHRRRFARFQLSDCPSGLRNQSRDENQSPLAHRMDDRVARRNRWSVSLLLVGPTIGRSDRLHVWGNTNPYFIFRVVAASSRPFWDNAGFTTIVSARRNSASAVVFMALSPTIFEDNFA